MEKSNIRDKVVISSRIEYELLAKARDGLLAQNLQEEHVATLSQIIRLSVMYGIAYMCEDPTSPASPESIQALRGRVRQKKPIKEANLDMIIKRTQG